MFIYLFIYLYVYLYVYIDIYMYICRELQTLGYRNVEISEYRDMGIWGYGERCDIGVLAYHHS